MTPAPDAAVQIARDAWDESATRPGGAWLATRAVVAALHERGWLHDPAEVAALRAVADAAQAWREQCSTAESEIGLRFAMRALDALPPADAPAVAQGDV